MWHCSESTGIDVDVGIDQFPSTETEVLREAHRNVLDRGLAYSSALSLFTRSATGCSAKICFCFATRGGSVPALCLQHRLHDGKLHQRHRRSAKGARELSRSAARELDLDPGAFRGLEGDSAAQGA